MNNAFTDYHFVLAIQGGLKLALSDYASFRGHFSCNEDLVKETWIQKIYQAFLEVDATGKRREIIVIHGGERGTQSIPYVSIDLGEEEFSESFMGDASGYQNTDGTRTHVLRTRMTVSVTVCAHTDEFARALNSVVFAILTFQRKHLLRSGYEEVEYAGRGGLTATERFIVEQAGAYALKQRWVVALTQDLVETPPNVPVSKPWFLFLQDIVTSPMPEPNQHPPVDPNQPNPTPSRELDDAGDAGGVKPYKES